MVVVRSRFSIFSAAFGTCNVERALAIGLGLRGDGMRPPFCDLAGTRRDRIITTSNGWRRV